jgi:hypothetical protein
MGAVSEAARGTEGLLFVASIGSLSFIVLISF